MFEETVSRPDRHWPGMDSSVKDQKKQAMCNQYYQGWCVKDSNLIRLSIVPHTLAAEPVSRKSNSTETTSDNKTKSMPIRGSSVTLTVRQQQCCAAVLPMSPQPSSTLLLLTSHIPVPYCSSIPKRTDVVGGSPWSRMAQ